MLDICWDNSCQRLLEGTVVVVVVVFKEEEVEEIMSSNKMLSICIQ